MFFIVTTLLGCATPGIRATIDDTSIEITPIKQKGATGLFTWFFKPKLPAGKYRAKFGDTELEFDTKKDMKLIDLDFNAVNR